MNTVLRRMTPMLFALGAIVLGAASMAEASPHSYINEMRSGTVSHVYFQQSLEGEYGTYNVETPAGTAIQSWKGYGIGTSVGIELMEFVQFTAGHTFLNMKYKDDSLESLSGSRLNAGVRFGFLSPVGNLEIGSGLLGSRLDYRRRLDNATFYGSGLYHSLSMNYFLSSRLSVYGTAKLSSENLVKNNGSADVSSIKTNTTQMGLGFRIWI